MTSGKRLFAALLGVGLVLGLAPTVAYVWAHAARGVPSSSDLLRFLQSTLFLPSDPVVYLLRLLGFEIYYVEAHGPTVHTYYVWALVCVSSLVFWLLVACAVAAAVRFIVRDRRAASVR